VILLNSRERFYTPAMADSPLISYFLAVDLSKATFGSEQRRIVFQRRSLGSNMSFAYVETVSWEA
jgi:hypothetical protein